MGWKLVLQAVCFQGSRSVSRELFIEEFEGVRQIKFGKFSSPNRWTDQGGESQVWMVHKWFIIKRMHRWLRRSNTCAAQVVRIWHPTRIQSARSIELAPPAHGHLPKFWIQTCSKQVRNILLTSKHLPNQTLIIRLGSLHIWRNIFSSYISTPSESFGWVSTLKRFKMLYIKLL